MARPMSARAQAGYFNLQQSKYLSEGLSADEARIQAAKDTRLKVQQSLYGYQQEQMGKDVEPFEKVAEQVQKATGLDQRTLEKLVPEEEPIRELVRPVGEELERVFKPETADKAAEAAAEQTKIIEEMKEKQAARIRSEESQLAQRMAARRRARRVGRRSLVSPGRLGYGEDKLGGQNA